MMLNGISKTPLYAAFFCAAILAACTSKPADQETATDLCSSPSTAIASVQGDTRKSPLAGQNLLVKGIVTLVQSGHGVYIEEAHSDKNILTSNALFIQSTQIPDDIEQGSLLSVQGTVSEIGDKRRSVTAITQPTALVQCSSGHQLPVTDVALPLDGSGREALENMRIHISTPLVATDVYGFGRGNVTLSGNGLQFVPTEVMTPGPEAAEHSSLNRNFALPVMLPEGLKFPELLISGTSIDQLTGVMTHDDRGLRLSIQELSGFSTVNFAAPALASPGSLRAVGMNLHNYFNGDGNGQGFPTDRGAETADEFQQQRNRIGAAIKVLNPDVLAVMELENDGFGPNSAAQDFIDLAHSATEKSWAVTHPVNDNTGSDKITVGIFYRSDRLKAIGPAQTLTGPEFKRSRQPQAQLFQELPSGDTILIVINHLKSKGSCPDSGENANQKDGQACWNPMRTASAEKMSAWAKDVAISVGTSNILILGDMNAYRNEDPINAIRQAGFTELMDDKQKETYSFVYFGQHGTLDYAFSSEPLLEKVQQAFIWHANVNFPVKMELPEPWLGFSDHDSVVVDIRSRQSMTSD